MIDNQKDLEKLLKLCRKFGVSEIKYGAVELKLGNPVTSDSPNIAADKDAGKYDSFPDGQLTPEQLMFYSAGGSPEDDPQNPNNA